MDERTLAWLDLLGRGLLWGAVAVLGLAFIASIAIVTSDSIGLFQENFERQSRGVVAIGAFASGLAASGGDGWARRSCAPQGRRATRRDNEEVARSFAMLKIGHKGADAIEPGNTLESFAVAAASGVDVIEFDVLRPRSDFPPGSDWRRAAAGPAAAGDALIIAHDWGAAARRSEQLTLDQALDAFARAPLDEVRFDLDLKMAGREDEVLAALTQRNLTERAMVSTMEITSLEWLREAAPDLDRGWTVPKVSKDWSRSRVLRPLYLAGSATFRARLPQIVGRQAPELGAWAVWVFHALITPKLIDAAHRAGVKVIAWTVDDQARIQELRTLGVDGIVSNDPGLLIDD